MLSMRLHAQDDKYQATRPPKRPVRKSDSTDARTYLRTVRPAKTNNADRLIGEWVSEGAL